MKPLLIVLALVFALAGTATAANEATPRERALTKQVSVLKAQIRKLKRDKVRLSTRVLILTSERNEAREEVLRLRGLIVNEVHALANAWRNDGNEKTGVSFYESSDYWSYSFNYCGFW
jgi:hypothetical protein